MVRIRLGSASETDKHKNESVHHPDRQAAATRREFVYSTSKARLHRCLSGFSHRNPAGDKPNNFLVSSKWALWYMIRKPPGSAVMVSF